MDDAMQELWASVPGFEGMYSVSTEGRVRSEGRTVSTRFGERRVFPRILRQHPAGNGYRGVNLSRGARRFPLRVHRLVAAAFLEVDAERPFVNHKNADKLDNRLSNLEWVSHRENTNHAMENGLVAHGERHALAKLTDDLVREACRRREGGETYRAIADDIGVDERIISSAVRGITWKHVQRQQREKGEG